MLSEVLSVAVSVRRKLPLGAAVESTGCIMDAFL